MKNGSKVSFVECVLVSSARILRTLTHLHISTWGTGSGKFNWRMLRETFYFLLQLFHTYTLFWHTDIKIAKGGASGEVLWQNIIMDQSVESWIH